MSTYKITNITNTIEKRNINFNSILNVEYIDGMKKKGIVIKPNETIYITISSLPISVQRLRIKNLVSVIEVDSTELNKAISKIKPKTIKAIKSSEIEPKLKEKYYNLKRKNKKDEEIIEGMIVENEQ
jgi:hypothetical protein